MAPALASHVRPAIRILRLCAERSARPRLLWFLCPSGTRHLLWLLDDGPNYLQREWVRVVVVTPLNFPLPTPAVAGDLRSEIRKRKKGHIIN